MLPRRRILPSTISRLQRRFISPFVIPPFTPPPPPSPFAINHSPKPQPGNKFRAKYVQRLRKEEREAAQDKKDARTVMRLQEVARKRRFKRKFYDYLERFPASTSSSHTTFHPRKYLSPAPSTSLTLTSLISSSLHIGHSLATTPKTQYSSIYGTRHGPQGLTILDVRKTLAQVRRACEVVREVVENDGIVLFVGGGQGSGGFGGKRGIDLERRLRAVKNAASKLGTSGFATGRFIPGSLSNANQVLRKSTIIQPPEVTINLEEAVVKARKASETVGKEEPEEDEVIIDGVTYAQVKGVKAEPGKSGIRKIDGKSDEVDEDTDEMKEFKADMNYEIVLKDGTVWRPKPTLSEEEKLLMKFHNRKDDSMIVGLGDASHNDDILEELDEKGSSVPNENLKIWEWEGMSKIVGYATGEIEWVEEKTKWFRDENAIKELEKKLIWNDFEKLKWEKGEDGGVKFTQMSEEFKAKMWLIWNNPEIDFSRKFFFVNKLLMTELKNIETGKYAELDDGNIHPEEIYYNQALSPEIKEFWLTRILKSKFEEFDELLKRLNLPTNSNTGKRLGPIVSDLMEQQGIEIPAGEETITTEELKEMGFGDLQKEGVGKKLEFSQDPISKVIRVVYSDVDKHGSGTGGGGTGKTASPFVDIEEEETTKDPIANLKLNEKPTELAIKLSSETLISKTYLYEQPTSGLKTTIIPLYDEELGLIPVPRISQLTGDPLNVFHSEFVPSLVVFLGPIRFMGMGIKECTQHNIPSIGIVDGDRDPRCVTWEILGNGEGARGIELIAGLLGKAGEEGKKRKIERRRQQMISLIQKRHQDVPNSRLQKCTNEELVYLMGGRISEKHARGSSKRNISIAELMKKYSKKENIDRDPKEFEDSIELPTEEDWSELEKALNLVEQESGSEEEEVRA